MPSLRVPGIGPNPVHPDALTTKERLGEICRLLALGLLRLRARDHAKGGQSSGVSPDGGESFVDCPARASGHATRPTQRRRRKA
jgi:hypothetical protein